MYTDYGTPLSIGEEVLLVVHSDITEEINTSCMLWTREIMIILCVYNIMYVDHNGIHPGQFCSHVHCSSP